MYSPPVSACVRSSASTAQALRSPLCSASDAAVTTGLLQPFVSSAPSASEQRSYRCYTFSRCDRCVFSLLSGARSLHPGIRARCCAPSRYGAMQNVAIGGRTVYGQHVSDSVQNTRPVSLPRCSACLRCDGVPLSRAGG